MTPAMNMTASMTPRYNQRSIRSRSSVSSSFACHGSFTFSSRPSLLAGRARWFPRRQSVPAAGHRLRIEMSLLLKALSSLGEGYTMLADHVKRGSGGWSMVATLDRPVRVEVIAYVPTHYQH